MTKNNIYLSFALLVTFALFYVGGCVHGKKHKICPQVASDTILVHDSIIHTIIDIFPYYVSHNDTIIYTDTVFKDVDTLEILRDYFAVHISDNQWKDSLVQVNIKTYISENKLKHSIFEYQILRPQIIVNNSVNNSVYYSKYLTFGIGVPVKNLNYINLEADFNWRKGYLGVQWTPELKSFGVKGGVTLLKFK